MRATGVGVRAVVVGVLCGLVVGLPPAGLAPRVAQAGGIAPASGLAQARPRNPSPAEITAAQRDRARKSAAVGRLTGLVARADGDMRRATDAAELAVERYNKAVVDLAAATRRATAARAAADRAERQVVAARAAVSQFARGSYIQGSTLGSAAALVDAAGPADLLARAALLRYISGRKLDAVGELDRAKVRQANADSLARQALGAQRAATGRATLAKAAAAREVATAHARLATLQKQRATLNRELTAARVRLTGLLAEKKRYQAWQRARAIAAAKERERLRRLRAAAARRHGTSGWTGGGGAWTAAKGQWVADAALRWLGTPYAWGGGDYSGPTLGVNGPGAGWNDGAVVGFDCSGLALWAWAQVGIYLPHYSGYQYQSGRHIPAGKLRPGDLVFWAYDSADPGTIHHVAIYLGGGRVVQAPQSGDVVRISAIWFDGYLGAARPGS
ncbi:MAG TPA: NlpC/P60 family protein [Mycobacteriales bacterium]|nr:NlpC/P60 family protein [Mycobacteriales bacterium]